MFGNIGYSSFLLSQLKLTLNDILIIKAVNQEAIRKIFSKYEFKLKYTVILSFPLQPRERKKGRGTQIKKRAAFIAKKFQFIKRYSIGLLL